MAVWLHENILEHERVAVEAHGTTLCNRSLKLIHKKK